MKHVIPVENGSPNAPFGDSQEGGLRILPARNRRQALPANPGLLVGTVRCARLSAGAFAGRSHGSSGARRRLSTSPQNVEPRGTDPASKRAGGGRKSQIWYPAEIGALSKLGPP